MESNRLTGSEIHGFHTMEGMVKESKTRWLRPNEIHAILCNHKYSTVYVKPMNLPKSGTIVLFDRKKLRNFRKDGHNWKKKKDGKTVKEAHEQLKVGDKERIHVYYAHGEDNSTFVRRCYWLLDKSLEYVVLVHYRETKESRGTPATPESSVSNSDVSDPSAARPLLEESDSMIDRLFDLEHHWSVTVDNNEQRLHDINTLEWDELLVPDNPNTPEERQAAGFEPANQSVISSYKIIDDSLPNNKVSPVSSRNSFCDIDHNMPNNLSSNNISNDRLEAQNSFERWVSHMVADSPGSLDGQTLESSISTGYHQPLASSPMDNHISSAPDQIFNIIDVSPSWALTTEETKILVIGCYNGGQLPHTGFSLHLACGDSIFPVETLQNGVFRCVMSPQTPGFVDLYLTLDGLNKPISQVLTFEFRSPVLLLPNTKIAVDDNSTWQEFQLQMRLSRLLFSPSLSQTMLSSKLSQSAVKEAKVFVQKTSHVSESLVYFTKMIESIKIPFIQAKDSLFELTLQNRLREWLLERVVAGSKISEYDEQGLGVIHLCAILDYTWSVVPYSCSGLSMDYRDKCGWTALHWAGYHGREKMVAALLSAGARPNLVTDPTSENPGGYTPADIASKNGYDGMAGYLAEKALVTQFNEMTLAGNASGSLQNHSYDEFPYEEKERVYLRDTLAAYRTAADAAARIHSAFRERSLKVRTEAAEAAGPEIEARTIVAVMKIQHAFRRFETRKEMGAALRIQYWYRTCKVRKDFLSWRRHAVRIQAVFRGFKVQRQYRKIVWSVGIFEKAILRWRLKRKGLHRLQVQSDPNTESDSEEEFFRASRKLSEERIERSVVNVQAMFRSRRAQEDYRSMKLEHDKAKLEYEGLIHPDANMG
ncbi:hypothetical protein CASFOL_021697 [Castilleja foliolosa]|uniref:CG-1 domain-containing protein n=1 Tax=Castilleja foliolosa TaxID=1961234 RepID=A0ABD3CXC0_9LAMI